MTVEEGGEEAFGDGRRARPEDGGGVADLHAVEAGLRTGEQGVERGGVTESGDLRDGGVECLIVLCFSVGGEGLAIEGHDFSSGGLRVLYSFDRRLDELSERNIGFAADEALAARGVGIGGEGCSRPVGGDGGAVVDVGVLADEPEDTEAGSGEVVELGFVFESAGGRPRAKEGADGGEAGIGECAFEGEMLLAELVEGEEGALCFFPRFFRVLVGRFVAEEVGAVIPEEAGVEALAGRFGLAGEREEAGEGFFAGGVALVLNRGEGAVGIQENTEADFLCAVAGACEVVAGVGGEAVVEEIECAQGEDSGAFIASVGQARAWWKGGTVMTPALISARKKRGVVERTALVFGSWSKARSWSM